MNFKELNPPIIELPAHQTWHRVQRKTGMQGSVRLNGIVYASAQHPYHGCVCLFQAGLDHTRRTAVMPLVQQATGNLHKAAMTAARGSQVPIVREM